MKEFLSRQRIWCCDRPGLTGPGRARQTKPEEHDRPRAHTHNRAARAIGELCRDGDFSIATDLDSNQKKKTITPGIWGVTNGKAVCLPN